MSGLDRVSVGNLKVAKVLHDFIADEVIPGTGIDPAAFWRGLDRIVHDFAPRNRALLKRRDELQAKIDAWHRGRRGQPSRRRRAQSVPRRDRLPRAGRSRLQRRHRQRRPRDRRHRRPAARRAGDERALCAQRRQCALGLALRRALRHRRHSARRDAAPREGLQSGAAASVSSPGRGASSTRAAPLASRLACRCAAATRSRTARSAWRLADGNDCRPERRQASLPAFAAARTHRPRILLRQQRPAHRDRRRSRASGRRATTPPASPTSSSKRRSPPSWIWRIRSPRSIRRQGRRLSQLARPDARARSPRHFRRAASRSRAGSPPTAATPRRTARR